MTRRDVTYVLYAVSKATGERRFVSTYPRYIEARADGEALPIHTAFQIERHSVATSRAGSSCGERMH